MYERVANPLAFAARIAYGDDAVRSFAILVWLASHAVGWALLPVAAQGRARVPVLHSGTASLCWRLLLIGR